MHMSEQRESHLIYKEQCVSFEKNMEQLHGERRMRQQTSGDQITSHWRSRGRIRSNYQDKHANARLATALHDGCFLIANCD